MGRTRTVADPSARKRARWRPAGVGALVQAAAIAVVLSGCTATPNEAAGLSVVVTDVRLLTAGAVNGDGVGPMPLAPLVLRGSDVMAALLASAADPEAPVELLAGRDGADAVRASALALPVPAVVETATVADGALVTLRYRNDADARRGAFCALGRWAFAIAQVEQPALSRPGLALPAQELIDDGVRRLDDACA